MYEQRKQQSSAVCVCVISLINRPDTSVVLVVAGWLVLSSYDEEEEASNLIECLRACALVCARVS